MKGDVFEIRLNATGASLLLRLKRLVVITFAAGILISLIDLGISYVRYTGYLKLLNASPWLIRFQANVSFYYMLFYPVLMVVQLYLLYRFCMKVHEGVRYSNESEFNQSFRWLLLYLAYSLFIVFLNLAFSAYILYTEWEIKRMYLT